MSFAMAEEAEYQKMLWASLTNQRRKIAWAVVQPGGWPSSDGTEAGTTPAPVTPDSPEAETAELPLRRGQALVITRFSRAGPGRKRHGRRKEQGGGKP